MMKALNSRRSPSSIGRRNFQASDSARKLMIVLVIFVVAAVFVLASVGKLSSDAVAFLLGTVLSAAFSYLRKLAPGSRR